MEKRSSTANATCSLCKCDLFALCLPSQAVFYPRSIAVLPAFEMSFEFALRFTPEKNCFPRMVAFSSSPPFLFLCLCCRLRPVLAEASAGSSPGSAANPGHTLHLLRRWEDRIVVLQCGQMFISWWFTVRCDLSSVMKLGRVSIRVETSIRKICDRLDARLRCMITKNIAYWHNSL